MQTFLPFASYARCAAVLDDKRLNKQILEAWQILTARVPQANHPACLMWRPYPDDLRTYLASMCIEYRRRYLKEHTLWDKIPPCTGCDEYRPFPVSNRVQIAHSVGLLRKRVSVPELSEHLAALMGRPFDLDEFPTGYFWPVDPVGQKARTDNENWKAFFRRNMI